MFQILLTIVVCQFRIIPAEATDSEGSMCPSVVYLKVGSEGQIPCTCGSFTIVAWYWKEEYDNRGSPIINYDKVQKTGSGYSSGEYDIAENGSLIISSVMRHHEGNFVVTVADDFQHREDTIFIKVIVVVPAAPPYPVVNDKVNQQHVYMDVNRNGTLRCAMFGVYPDVNLTFTSESDKIIFQHDSVLKTPLQNNTFDVTFNMHYIVTDLTLKRLTIFCKVADENIAEQFPDKTKVDLLFLPVYPVVNGHVNQRHVYLDVDREGHLTCMKENVDAGTTLVWKIVDPSMQEQITFQSREIVLNNNDGTVTINQTFDYEINDHSVDRITIECAVVTPDTNDIPFATKVDLLFQNVYPVVNGHVSQRHVYLDVDREGHLTCIKENVDAGTTLVWKIVDTSMWEKITFQSREIVSNNNDGTVTINRTFYYEIHDPSLDRITIECAVVTPDSDDIPLTTKVDLLFQSVYPVVNGHVNQRHVYLDVDRMGHLSCVKKNADAESTLVWVVDPTLHGKIMFESNIVISDNSDGTVNINKTFHYEVRDHSMDRITIECKIVEHNTDEHLLATKVDLLFQNVYPVVNGHVNQNHVYLDVGRMGHLTCMKENVIAGTTLDWVLDSDLRGKVAFQSRTITLINSDGTVNINQTFDYEILDNTLDRITLECRVIELESVEHPLTTTVELIFSSDGNTNNSTWGAVFAEILKVLLVIALGLLVLILWYKNRKMHKKFEVKFLKPILDMHTHNEYTSPEEGTNGTALYCTPNGGPVVCSDDVCDASRQEVQDINESLESPDSGNSGSNSRELSGSEASEKSGLMDDIEMSCNNSKQDPLHVNKEGFEDTPMV